MLVLVRHGRTVWNRERRFVGRSDVSLDEHGRAQARAAGAAIGAVAELRTSPLSRARETAALLGTGLEPTVDDAFVELDYGELEGTLVADADPSLWRSLREDPSAPMPGGESLADVQGRVDAALEGLFGHDGTGARRRDADVVVVSHVSPIKAAVAWALDARPDVALRLRLDNGSITRIGWGTTGPVVVSYNLVPPSR